ncbi:MAG: hypothetical protein AAFR00_13190 [Pseudomonadota bacterium]
MTGPIKTGPIKTGFRAGAGAALRALAARLARQFTGRLAAGLALGLAMLTLQAGAAGAETFRLSRGETLYGCGTQASMHRMLKAAGLPSYSRAAARVEAYERTACPRLGPFRSDRLHARVIIDEPGRLVGGYTRIVMVEWRVTGSSRLRRSLLVRAPDGRWHDAVDAVIDLRTTNGIGDVLRAN